MNNRNRFSTKKTNIRSAKSFVPSKEVKNAAQKDSLSENQTVCIRKSRIFGEIELSGAKNSALPIIAAAVLCQEPVVLYNMPTELNDVKVMTNLLREANYLVEINHNENSIRIERPSNKDINSVFSQEASKIRYSLLLLPAFQAVNHYSEIPSPGGCNLGNRMYDIHLDTLRKFGCEVTDDNKTIRCFSKNKMKCADLLFHIATTSGTEGAIIGAVLTDGVTTIRNANTRPEVIDLVNFLNKMGARIRFKTRYIEIEGVKKLKGGSYSILSDRHEAVSYAILAAMCRGEIQIKHFSTCFVHDDISLLREIGIDIFEWGNDLYVSAKGKKLKPFSMSTGAYPSINSDMQPLFAALALTIKGESLITDTRFTGRFQYVDEFKLLGADIVNYENCAIVTGGRKLIGTNVCATDLRAGAALTFLGGVSEGITYISNYYQTLRGYENIIQKLNMIGFKIKNKG